MLNKHRNPPYVCVCGSASYVIAEYQPLPVFQQIQKTVSLAAVYFWMFKHRWSALHLCFSGVEEQRVLWGFFRRERKRAALGQETQTDFPGGKPCSPVMDLQRENTMSSAEKKPRVVQARWTILLFTFRIHRLIWNEIFIVKYVKMLHVIHPLKQCMSFMTYMLSLPELVQVFTFQISFILFVVHWKRLKFNKHKIVHWKH